MGALIRALYVLVGLAHRLFHPYRVQRFGGGFIYLGTDAVWYIGPEGGAARRLSEPAFPLAEPSLTRGPR